MGEKKASTKFETLYLWNKHVTISTNRNLTTTKKENESKE